MRFIVPLVYFIAGYLVCSTIAQNRWEIHVINRQILKNTRALEGINISEKIVNRNRELIDFAHENINAMEQTLFKDAGVDFEKIKQMVAYRKGLPRKKDAAITN